MPQKIKHLIADAAAFISNAPLRDLAEKVYTVPEVIAESCDRATRRRLRAFPVDVTYKEPSSEALTFVATFSRKTGDYGALSCVDLKVLALTYDIVKQYEGEDAFRKEPDNKSAFILGKTGDPAKAGASQKTYGEGDCLPSDLIEEGSEEEEDGEEEEADMEEAEENGEDASLPSKDNNAEAHDEQSEDCKDMDDEEEEEEEEESSDDDDDDWITPTNIADVKRSMGAEDAVELEEAACVGCLTTDFAMQNVLVQLGLKVIALDGKLIKQVKTYVLRCFGCLRITKDTSKRFCPHCGNKTLRRLTTSLGEDGTIKYHLARNFTCRIRGLKYSLPKPQGGKHALNPALTADQKFPDQRAGKKFLQRVDILSADVVEGSSPFRLNDVTSKAAQLGLGSQRPQWSKRNPNENNRKGKTRRKK